MDSKEILKNPKLFYQKIAKLLSLAGKVTFAHRGSGTVAQVWLATVHMFHQLPVPILKKAQLDCLNIVLSGSIEAELVLHFFRRETLHPSVKKYLEFSEKEPKKRIIKKIQAN